MALIETLDGLLEEETLRKVEGVDETENERTVWVEHWLGEKLVKRSAHMQLKKSPAGAEAIIAALSNRQG